MWNLLYGSWWMIQWSFDGWFSIGIHVDAKHRTRTDGKSYGPYADFHLGVVILSFGYHPYLSGELEKQISVSRGGL